MTEKRLINNVLEKVLTVNEFAKGLKKIWNIKLTIIIPILINIGIIIISFIFQILFTPFVNTLIIRTFSSTLLISLFAIITYCILCCLQGNEPDLPGISQATKMQL